MPTSREVLSALSKEDLIGTVQALEDSLAEAATGLMKEGSVQEYAALKVRYAVAEMRHIEHSHHLEMAIKVWRERYHGIPRLIRWWYGC